MTAPMPKDNEVDEKVRPVAVVTANGYIAWLTDWLMSEDWMKSNAGDKLYSAATVAELRTKADAAERRVGELGSALSDLISVADPLALAPREYERIREQTARGTRISIDPFPLLKCRNEDVVDLTDGLKRARATLTGADPT